MRMRWIDVDANAPSGGAAGRAGHVRPARAGQPGDVLDRPR